MSDDSIFGKVTPEKTAQHVIRRIEVLILEGVLRSGEKLPSERDLAIEMDVSRPILREALKSLEMRGILETRHGQGTVIANITGTLFSEPVAKMVKAYPRTRQDYVEFRSNLESFAASLAAERASAHDLAMLKDIFAGMERAHKKKNIEDEARYDLEFHMMIADCSHNVILIHSLRSCYQLLAENVLLNRSKIFDFPGARDAFINQHKAILEAIIERNPGLAAKSAAAHIDYVSNTMESVDKQSEWQKNAELRFKRFQASEK